MQLKMQKKIKDLEKRKAKIEEGGGEEATARQHAEGKLTARERLNFLFEPETFEEFGSFVNSSCTDFGMDRVDVPCDGIVSGWGKIDGRSVFAYSQDYTVFGGSGGPEHGKKQVKTIYQAGLTGVPLVIIIDSGGIRPQEQQNAMDYQAKMFTAHTTMSGVVPQIALIMGPAPGGQAYASTLCDFLFMTKGTSTMYIGGPPVVKAVIGEDVTNEELGGAEMHAKISGCCDLVANNDQECIEKAKDLLRFLPSNNTKKPPFIDTGDDPNRTEESLCDVVPTNSKKPYDMHEVISRVVDNGQLFEIKPDFARNIIIGFARLGGNSAGILANQPLVAGGVMDSDAADKVTRFITFCDAFNIPLVHFVDTPAYMVGTKAERTGGIRHSGKHIYAINEATVPKIAVVIRKCYGAAGMIMGGKLMADSDQVFAWPTAEFAVYGLEAGMSVILRSKAVKEMIAEAKDPDKLVQQMRQTYIDKMVDVYNVAPPRHVEDIIDPRKTRPTLIKSLDILANKKVERPWKKHGIPPV